jgi:hypothetical protein
LLVALHEVWLKMAAKDNHKPRTKAANPTVLDDQNLFQEAE